MVEPLKLQVKNLWLEEDKYTNFKLWFFCCLSGADWGDWSGREWLNKFQWVCLAYDQVGRFSINLIKIGRYSMYVKWVGRYVGRFQDQVDQNWKIEVTQYLFGFLGRSRTQRSKMRSGKRLGFLTRRDMASFVLQVEFIQNMWVKVIKQ